MPTRLSRPLDAVEVRVLGALLEKEQTNPETCPLTVNAVLQACNQKTNRDPVVELSEDQVVSALDRLRAEVLVWRSEGARSERWQQSVSRRWGLSPGAKALLTLLLLRGPQTPGELRTRGQRLHSFPSVEAVEEALQALSVEDEPLVRELPRRPGQKETRWIQLVGEVAAAAESEDEPFEAPVLAVPGAAGTPGAPPSLTARVAALEAQVARLADRLAFVSEQLGLPADES
jgi:uncharacterized protein YceH (UPF0502 family)